MLSIELASASQIQFDMTPYLHPRSRVTSSLFGTTLLVSFLVVGMPHILPCPAPRVMLADSESEKHQDGQRRRRKIQNPQSELESGDSTEATSSSILVEEQLAARNRAHECPVPKPRGVLGRFLGFDEDESKPKPARTQVEVLEREQRPER